MYPYQMSNEQDSFESFRKKRQAKSYRPERTTDRGQYAARIAQVLSDVTSGAPRAGVEAPVPQQNLIMPDGREVQEMICRLYEAYNASDASRQQQLAYLILRFVESAERLLEGKPPESSSEPNLVDFMKKPPKRAPSRPRN